MIGLLLSRQLLSQAWAMLESTHQLQQNADCSFSLSIFRIRKYPESIAKSS